MDSKFKYEEPYLLQEVLAYIENTYTQHYVGQNNLQTVDVWGQMGIAEEACISNVVKYATRYGKKEGKNEKDLFKLIHYAILTMYFNRRKQQEKTPITSKDVSSTLGKYYFQGEKQENQ